MEEQNIDEVIDRFVNNEMTDEEREAFEKSLGEDPSLASRVSLYKSVDHFLHQKHKNAQAEAAFLANLKTIIAEESTKSPGKQRFMPWYAWAAAACVILMAGVGVYWFLDKPTYHEYAHYEVIALAERGDNEAEKRLAEQAFNSKQYEQAIVHFNAILKSDSLNYTVLYYKGIALLESGQTTEAETLFGRVQQSASVLAQHATWMRALAALKEKRYDDCREWLRKIPNSSDKYENAQELLKALD